MATIYYAINETAARTAHEMNSMRDYRENEKTKVESTQQQERLNRSKR